MNQDTETLQTLRQFLTAEKPSDIAPLDILQIVYLISRKAEDHSIFDSQQTLAQKFNADRKSIMRSQQRLAELGWISRPQRRGKTNAIALRYENIPAEESLRLQITQAAKDIAVRYQVALQNFGRRKFPKVWLSQQFLSSQRILNECSGDVALACRVIGHAVYHPQHCKTARQSLYNLYARWPKIWQTYSANQEQAKQRTGQEQQ